MAKFIDVSGLKFGRLTVLDRAENHILPSGKPRTMWNCRCDCGKVVQVSYQNLKQGTTVSCGCWHKEVFKKPVRDLAGSRFEKLVVVERAESRVTSSGQHKTMWKCQCDCGGFCVVSARHLSSGKTQSCGCTKSRMEAALSSLLKQNGMTFVKEKSFEDLVTPKGGRMYFDFAIYNDGQLIALLEAQGIQHYIEEPAAPEFGKYEREVTDPLKRQYCQDRSIPLFEIAYSDCLEYEFYNMLIELYVNTVPSVA